MLHTLFLALQPGSSNMVVRRKDSLLSQHHGALDTTPDEQLGELSDAPPDARADAFSSFSTLLDSTAHPPLPSLRADTTLVFHTPEDSSLNTTSSRAQVTSRGETVLHDQPVQVQVPQDFPEFLQGLMWRRDLEGKGMLFQWNQVYCSRMLGRGRGRGTPVGFYMRGRWWVVLFCSVKRESGRVSFFGGGGCCIRFGRESCVVPCATRGGLPQVENIIIKNGFGFWICVVDRCF